MSFLTRAVTDDAEAFISAQTRHDVLQQTGAVERLDLDVDGMRRRDVVGPARLQDALGLRVHVGDVRTIGAMHGDAFADRDEAHDRIARHRTAAFREPHQHVVDAGDPDSRAAARDAARRRTRKRRDVDDVRILELFAHALGDRNRRCVAEPDRRVEIGRRRVVHLVRDAFERFAARRIGPQVLTHELGFERFLAGEHVLFFALFAEPLLDLVLRARRAHDRRASRATGRAAFC